MSQYPRDEFDKVPESSARQGVHRERLIPARSSGLGLIITVGVLALVVGLAAFFVLPRLGIGAGSPAPASSPGAAAAESGPSATPDAEEPQPATDTAAPTSSPSPSPTEEPREEEDPAPVVDRTQPVVVLNGTTVGGLGASVSARIGQDGWTAAQVGNWQGAPLQSSVVYYSEPEQQANAEALAALLNIPAVVQTPGFTYVTVVAGPGFQ